MANKVLVTAALTYANGPAHLGHVLEAIQTDVYVRARRMMGDEVIFMWADDTHGTPIQIRALREGIDPEQLIARVYDEHVKAYDGFQIGYDIFYTTHSEENRKHAAAIFEALRERGDIEERDVEQLYSEVDQMFLPDRMVQGTCPVCKTPDQDGDSCESCGSTYRPTELIEPRSVISGDTPVLRSSEHLFVPLARHEAFLREWLKPVSDGGTTILQDSVRNFVLSWVDGGLRDWDISREAPYFGIEIPGYPGKYFYVWFDAPIGYIAATEKWCELHGQDLQDWWKAPPGRGDGQTEIVHVIGKDIVYFHCLFWPAMLHAAGYTVPSRVQVHGWLKVNGEKMSKRRGTFILANTYLEHADPAYLRYYLAARLSSNQDDFDLAMDDFVARVNADLVGKAANLASRSIKFINSKLGGTLGPIPEDGVPVIDAVREKLLEVPDLYRNFDSAKALRLAMEMAETCDAYINEHAPWKVIKTDPERARAILTVGVQVSKMVGAVLQPVIPEWGEKIGRMLKLEQPLTFANAAEPLAEGLELGAYETLAERLQSATLDALIEASKADVAADRAVGAAPEDAPSFAYEVEPLAPEVGIEALGQIDLRVGKIVECEPVPKAKKLLRLTVDLGPLGQRNVFSGISQSYAPEQLLGKHVVMFANLKPRTMRFGVSEGMIMAAGQSDDKVTVIELDPRSLPGDKIS
ncbi:methionine--tRNA ligase [Enhygromyxa salina]|uniref:Methionine--tRNA ligase n=1 Tax=Enhygromyxa salina TaxID=215803 RepID=A0A2S9YT95_9BACT|nr:methionine--tRNA ligase [Enhygromyxa salina]PRQ08252.1 Methionine--tRNA ligase [Enhygromyxa salina]